MFVFLSQFSENQIQNLSQNVQYVNGEFQMDGKSPRF